MTNDHTENLFMTTQPPEQELSAYDQALFAYIRGDFTLALNMIDRMIHEDSATAEVHNLRGTIHQQQENHQAAIGDFTQAIALDGRCADCFNNRALSYQVLEDVESAEADLVQALEIDPTLGMAYYNLGSLRYSEEEFEAAISLLEEAAQLETEDSDVWFQLALAYDRTNQIEKAVDALTTAIAIDQGFDDRSFYLRGIFYAELGEWTQAEHDFEQALSRGLRNGETLFYRGLARYYQEDLQGALTDMQEAIAYEPELADAHYYLSYIHARLGNQDLARDHAQIALDLDPPVESE